MFGSFFIGVIMQLVKNEEYHATISAFGANGEGIVKTEGITVFVPYAMPQEKVQFKVLKVKKNYAFGKVTKIFTPAEDRVRAKCPVFEKCGGCQLQHVKYASQLKFKTKLVQDCFRKIAGLEVQVSPCHKSDQEWEYRNKLQLPVSRDEKGTHVGFFAENSHRIVDISACPIHPSWAKDVISVIKNYLSTCDVQAYREEDNSGVLRHVVVREVCGKLMLVFVINAEDLPYKDVLIERCKEKFHDFSLFYNVNQRETNVICGEKYVCFYGKPRMGAEEMGIRYEAGPETFLQVNGAVRKKIYEKAIKLAISHPETVVIDAYSGGGMMTALCAKNAKHAYGIEIVPEAVSCANTLAEKNGLQEKMTNICGDCEQELVPLVKKLRLAGEKISVILDPPRKGCSESVLQTLMQAKPDKIVYVSCNPATLARDVAILTDRLVRMNGELLKNDQPNPIFDVVSVEPYDMFPQTKHVESVVCLTRK